MPLNIDLLQILLHIFNFLILFGGLTLLLYKPVNKFLEERKNYYKEKEESIKAAADENSAIQAKYEKLIKDTDEEIAEMKLKAEKEIADISKDSLSKAEKKAASIISAAEKEAESRKEHILDSVQTEIGEIVVTATQKLLSDTADPKVDSALYDEFIRLTDKRN